MPRMPKQNCGTTVICYSNKSSTKDLENRLKKLEDALLDKDPSENPDLPNVPDTPEQPEPEVEMVDIYFYDGFLLPNANSAQGWIKETVLASIRKEGITHTYDPAEEFYPAIAYPESWGELAHIYQGGSTAFDLITVFEKEIITKDGKKYWHYYFPDSVVASKTVLTFLWAA